MSFLSSLSQKALLSVAFMTASPVLLAADDVTNNLAAATCDVDQFLLKLRVMDWETTLEDFEQQMARVDARQFADVCKWAKTHAFAVTRDDVTYCGLVQLDDNPPMVVLQAKDDNPYSAIPVTMLHDLVTDMSPYLEAGGEGGCAELPDKMAAKIAALAKLLPIAEADAASVKPPAPVAP